MYISLKAQTEYTIPEEHIQTLPDTVRLNIVTVTAGKQPVESLFTTTKIDLESIERSGTENLGALLIRHTPLILKEYGPGNLATPAFRGTSSAHTRTEWNGLPLNSAMLGQSDFGLIPVFMADEMILKLGMASLSDASGGLGGSVSMESKPDFTLSRQYGARIVKGSFGSLSGGADLAYTYKKWQSRSQVQFDRTDNDFPFPNRYASTLNPPTEKRLAAGWERLAWAQHIYAQPDPFNLISLQAWGQNYHRDVPAPIASPQNPGNETVSQDYLGVIAGWKYEKPGISSQVRVGGSYDYFHYQMKSGGINSRAATLQAVFKHTGTFSVTPSLQFRSSLSIERQQVDTRNYAELKVRHLASAWVQGNQRFGTFAMFSMGVRKDISLEFATPFLPSLRLQIYPARNQNFYISAGWAANHRIPSFNDLYWVPGGNPDLVPEKGYTTELASGFEKSISTLCQYSLRLALFNIQIDNWIAWLPDSSGAYWTPDNLNKVSSRGIESYASFFRQWGQVRIKMHMAWNLTIAMEESNAHKIQLPYTPRHSGNTSLTLSFERFRMDYSIQYTGARYITANPDQILPAYTLHQAGTEYEIISRNTRIVFSFKVFNIFNTYWESIVWHPMPGRHFRMSVAYRFRKN